MLYVRLFYLVLKNWVKTQTQYKCWAMKYITIDKALLTIDMVPPTLENRSAMLNDCLVNLTVSGYIQKQAVQRLAGSASLAVLRIVYYFTRALPLTRLISPIKLSTFHNSYGVMFISTLVDTLMFSPSNAIPQLSIVLKTGVS